jgi:hypothetical protein
VELVGFVAAGLVEPPAGVAGALGVPVLLGAVLRCLPSEALRLPAVWLVDFTTARLRGATASGRRTRVPLDGLALCVCAAAGLALPGLSRGRLAARVRGDARADAGHQQRGAGRHGLGPGGGHRLGDRHHLLAREEARAQEGGQREEAGGALDRAADGRPGQRGDVEPGGHRHAAARLAVRDVAREAARVARTRGGAIGRGDDRLDAHAALTGDELVVLLGQRLRARKSVLSTPGRLRPMRSPISR